MAEACVLLTQLPQEKFGRLVAPAVAPLINIGTGEDQSIAELATIVAEVVGFTGQFTYDSSKPDGMARKLLDVSRIAAIGWKPSVDLRSGLALAYADFQRRHAAVP